MPVPVLPRLQTGIWVTVVRLTGVGETNTVLPDNLSLGPVEPSTRGPTNRVLTKGKEGAATVRPDLFSVPFSLGLSRILFA